MYCCMLRSLAFEVSADGRWSKGDFEGCLDRVGGSIHQKGMAVHASGLGAASAHPQSCEHVTRDN